MEVLPRELEDMICEYCDIDMIVSTFGTLREEYLFTNFPDTMIVDAICRSENMYFFEKMLDYFEEEFLFLRACRIGWLEGVKKMSDAVFCWGKGLLYCPNVNVCEYLIKNYKIQHGFFDDAMACAAGQGNMDIVMLMVDMGANDWMKCMVHIILYSKYNVADFFIDSGFDDWDDLLIECAYNAWIDGIEYCFNNGATKFRDALDVADDDYTIDLLNYYVDNTIYE